MKVVVMEYDSQKEINRISIPQKKDEATEAIFYIEKMQREEDILKLGKLGMIEHTGFGLGISHVYQKGPIWSTRKIENCDSFRKPGVITIGVTDNQEDNIPETIKFRLNGEAPDDTGLKISLFGYKEGLVLGVGKKYASGFLGMGDMAPAYFIKNTSKNSHSGSIEKAKAFDSPKKMLDYLKKNEEIFKYLVENYNYNYYVEYATEYYKKDIDALEEKSKRKWDNSFSELTNYLELLNNSEIKEKIIPVPKEATEDEIEKEVELRMSTLKLASYVLTNYKKKKIMMSEFSGILYDLTEEAKKAVSLVEDMGNIPYHVIRTQTIGGDIYDVLFVSDKTEEWNEERPSDLKDDIRVITHNASLNTTENEKINFHRVNGGLMRIL